MINEIDVKLIKELQKDGRASNKTLAQNLGIHPSTVSRKIQMLIDSGTITIRGLPNLEKLGYNAQALLVVDTDILKMDKICEILYKNFHVNSLLTIFGPYNLLVIVHYFSWNELLSFISDELSRMDGVRKIEIHLIKETKKRYYGIFEESQAVSGIDDIDQKIIEKLSENGRYTARYLAGDIGISFPTCVRRINNLLKNNLITIRGLLNPTKIGFVSNAFLFLHVEPDHVESVCSIIYPLGDVHSLFTLFSGGHNVVFGIHSRTAEELFDAIKKVMNKILVISPITNTQVFIRSEIKKRYYGGFLE